MNKIKKPTKEELIIKVAELELKNEDNIAKEQSLKREFARAFGWFKKQKEFGYSSIVDLPEVITPSWMQIFVHLGSLLSDRSLVDLIEKHSKLSTDFEALQNEWFRSREAKKEPPFRINE